MSWRRMSPPPSVRCWTSDTGGDRVIEHVRHDHLVGRVQLAIGVIRIPVQPHIAAPHVRGRGIGEQRRIRLIAQNEMTPGATAGGPDGQGVEVRSVVGRRNGRRARDQHVERASTGWAGAEEPQLYAERQILKPAQIVQHPLASVRPDVGQTRHDAEPVGDGVSRDQRNALRRQRADVPVRSLQGSFPVLIPAVVGVEYARAQRPLGHHEPVVHCLSGGRRGADRGENQPSHCSVEHGTGWGEAGIVMTTNGGSLRPAAAGWRTIECANVVAGFSLRNIETIAILPFRFDRRDRN